MRPRSKNGVTHPMGQGRTELLAELSWTHGKNIEQEWPPERICSERC